jgi:phosphate ABC transporter phosphate-binding protein
VALLAAVAGSTTMATPAAAGVDVPISGAGSTWAANAFDEWRSSVAQYGMAVNYAPVGSSTGRNEFKNGQVDWAVSDIPYGALDGSNLDPPPSRRFAYSPATAGGVALMYNLNVGTMRVTNLRLSGPVIAGIFTGTITMWNDPAIAADNPGLALPATKIVPVVRSDGSGATRQFTQWLATTQPAPWSAYCQETDRNPCTATSAYPVLPGPGMVAQAGDNGVSGYVSQPTAAGAIGYVENSYALETRFPVAKVLNAAGYYTEPTSGHVAVSLLNAKINTDSSNPSTYLIADLSGVYTDTDPRTYPLSYYSYLIVPTALEAGFTTDRGATLGDFGRYALCQGQVGFVALVLVVLTVTDAPQR